MNSRVISAILLLGVIQGSLAISCYQCAYETSPTLGEDDGQDMRCADNEDDISAELSDSCDYNAVACFSYYSVSEDGVEAFLKGCVGAGDQRDRYDGNEDACASWEAFGVEYYRCICSSDNCNGSAGLKMSSFVLLAALLRHLAM